MHGLVAEAVGGADSPVCTGVSAMEMRFLSACVVVSPLPRWGVMIYSSWKCDSCLHVLWHSLYPVVAL